MVNSNVINIYHISKINYASAQSQHLGSELLNYAVEEIYIAIHQELIMILINRV